MPTTFVERSDTNLAVYQKAPRCYQLDYARTYKGRRTRKVIRPLSELWKDGQMQYYREIRTSTCDPFVLSLKWALRGYHMTLSRGHFSTRTSRSDNYFLLCPMF